MSDTFRALCAELLKALESWSPGGGGPLEDADEIAEADLMDRARTLLAQPEPEGLTDEVILGLADEFLDWNRQGILAFGRAAIAADRARRPTPQPPADGEVGE